MVQKFSIITSVYKNDNPQYVRVALDSMLVHQSVKPNEIVLVQDGPVPYELSRLLIEFKDNYGDLFHVIKLEKNGGLGNALKLGVDNAQYDIIARMDSDDICLPDRFEKQLAYLETHPECDIVGGQMTEFIGDPGNIVGRREVPLTNNEIYEFMKSRCALNHVTVMFRKVSVLNAGNYQDWFWNEDYYLWVRMMMKNCVFANIPDVAVNVRSGADQYARRGGKRYFKSEIGIKKLMYGNGMITRKEYIINYVERFIIQLILPNSVRGWVFRMFARKKQMNYNNNTNAFFALLKAGLWENEVQLSHFNEIDYSQVLSLAEEQSIVGLVAAGLEHVTDVKVPKELTLQFVGHTLQLEQRNLAMNAFIEDIVGEMRKADIYALLVKGQGVAQCYERPLWRACGDVDFLLSDVNYDKAKAFLIHLASYVGYENTREKHLPLTIKSWLVELHGTLYSDCLRRMDRGINQIQDDIFCGGNVRSWMNGKTHVFLPSAENDAMLIFSHILKHYFRNGIGLRQICDWCRLLWSFKDSINKNVLEDRIRAMGIMTEWKVFSSLAVNTLGMPVDAMPFYDDNKKWRKKSDLVLKRIMSDGNFGQNRDTSYAKRHNPIVRKLISFWRHTCDSIVQLEIFPIDTIRAWNSMVVNGVKDSGNK